ncbi:Hypothetical protein DEACI_2245 [Acididesulfobacillus acetoxydans]|uniref:Uncharacterized protein n=1 Tax=Acididesulfobacillus acetoxydans TaxID=1561005 RepID=A0A8S0W3E3_9FIRM|nr:hypothetical protein [Acididesulfobacillus acetoxydans]CAA7601578.1 Hypothetical protein DEACI_2245 [Acididesulfobacillus acetoxydans]CEJ07065.1 Hypothetical protein DEACI_1521 [Acididesulfobacillus acetoxydans]
MCGGRSFGRTFFDYFGGCGGSYGGGCGSEDYYEPYDRPDARRGAGIDREPARIEAEVRAMYASGEITQRQYYDALAQLDRGMFTGDDLQQLRQPKRGLGRVEQEGASQNRGLSPELQKGTSDLEKQKNQIKEEKTRTESVLTNIRDSITKLKEQMTLDEKMARGVVSTDEEQARSYLRHRQELVEQTAGLEARFKELSNDLAQLEQAELRIDAKMTEMEALAQRERLIRLTGEIKG